VRKTSPTKRATPRRIVRPASVDDYLARVRPEHRRALVRLRSQIRAAAPGATEAISYGLPTFKLGGRPLIYFGAWADHCSIYGVPTDAPELEGYDVRRGTIRFAADRPLPASLVSKLVKARIVSLKKGSY
jgi:uncharacterized protein YdhG (YjbR/CyaY superfamily)